MRFCAIILFLSFVLPAHAQIAKDAKYFCTEEFTAGLSYNQNSKRWQSTIFRPKEKFVLSLKFLGTGMRKSQYLPETPISKMHVTITAAGTSVPQPCNDLSRYGNIEYLELTNDLWTTCNSNLTEYSFNLKTNRYLAGYLIGYVSGQDNNNDTPMVAGGTCTKIE